MSDLGHYGHSKSVYLVVADASEEFNAALRFAARLAEFYDGHVGVLFVTRKEEFTHWGDIEKRMRKEQRDEAEQTLWRYANRVHDWNKQICSLYLEEGEPIDTILRVIEEDLNIHKLILASGTGSSPGPLVSHFTTKGLSRLRVPLTIVPGHLGAEDIDSVL